MKCRKRDIIEAIQRPFRPFPFSGTPTRHIEMACLPPLFSSSLDLRFLPLSAPRLHVYIYIFAASFIRPRTTYCLLLTGPVLQSPMWRTIPPPVSGLMQLFGNSAISTSTRTTGKSQSQTQLPSRKTGLGWSETLRLTALLILLLILLFSPSSHRHYMHMQNGIAPRTVSSQSPLLINGAVYIRFLEQLRRER